MKPHADGYVKEGIVIHGWTEVFDFDWLIALATLIVSPSLSLLRALLLVSLCTSVAHLRLMFRALANLAISPACRFVFGPEELHVDCEQVCNFSPYNYVCARGGLDSLMVPNVDEKLTLTLRLLDSSLPLF